MSKTKINPLDASELNIQRSGIVPMLIAVQIIVLFPLWFEIPFWISLATMSLIALKYASVRFNFRLSNWFILLLVGSAFVAIYSYYKTVSGRDAGVGLICLMYGFKLLETKNYRDSALVLFISFFIMVTAFLFNQSIVMGLYLIIATLTILLGLVALNSINGMSGIKSLGKLSSGALLQALPIMLLLFFLFPRLPGPLWGMPDRNQSGTGISDSMSPGDIGLLTFSDDPAFRVKFKGSVPSANQMYWRGMIFSDYDGYIWRQGARSPQQNDSLPPRELVFEYQVQMEPNMQKWLFGLEQIGAPPKSTTLFSDMTWRNQQKIFSNFRYQAQSVAYDYTGISLSGVEKKINLQLPPDSNERTKVWAKNLYKSSEGTADYIQTILNIIHQGEYRYTLTPEILDDQLVDSFWLGTKEGFCEHYAGAFVFIMRAAGIPARVVTGYQGGEYNPYGDYYLIKQSDAHAWTEVWIDDKGWVRVDPTSAIHPSRVELDLRTQTNRRDSWLSDKVVGFDLPEGLLSKLRLRWDSVKSFWDNSLMGYGQDKQNDWLSKIGINNNQWRYLGYGLVATLLFFGLLFGLWLLRNSQSRDPIEKAYDKLKAKLLKEGVEVPNNQGPSELMELLKSDHPELYKKYATAIKYYIKLRYKTLEPDLEWLKRFKYQVNKL